MTVQQTGLANLPAAPDTLDGTWPSSDSRLVIPDPQPACSALERLALRLILSGRLAPFAASGALHATLRLSAHRRCRQVSADELPVRRQAFQVFVGRTKRGSVRPTKRDSAGTQRDGRRGENYG
jgi:hypothetical protein